MEDAGTLAPKFDGTTGQISNLLINDLTALESLYGVRDWDFRAAI